ncbi:ligand-binding SRPBCC domain-containing protein [Runella defluvii]|uniref:Ligand-binding SRPBCC domain-containing protein n=1 Tax=Runella defluvii TaxID=370973 RepID=A0A7W5ZKJ2_9BACT|nr:hypothetical protein [Runella defluvii]MBB3837499.1 ligand-binding SRPBCC domain-containing protein [Runella defluvii]HAK79005.1 hypothetical protein [Runella sp.]HAO51173.1 hypothetical protein [Runella sp.]
MKLRIQTHVSQPYQVVWQGFNEELFRKLSPPFPPVRVVRFDGCLAGDMVVLELNFLLFKQQWISRITEQQSSESEIYFVDEGTKLPFFLRFWRHRHRIIREKAGGTIIADEIEFRTPLWVIDYLMYPLLWAQFAYRKPIYKKAFALSPHLS